MRILLSVWVVFVITLLRTSNSKLTTLAAICDWLKKCNVRVHVLAQGSSLSLASLCLGTLRCCSVHCLVLGACSSFALRWLRLKAQACIPFDFYCKNIQDFCCLHVKTMKHNNVLCMCALWLKQKRRFKTSKRGIEMLFALLCVLRISSWIGSSQAKHASYLYL